MAISGFTLAPYQAHALIYGSQQRVADVTERQFVAATEQSVAAVAENAATAAPAKTDSGNPQQAFLDQMLEQMLANRIGLDKKKYNEILERMKELEAEKDKLAQEPQTPARDNQMSAIDQKLVQLNKALEGLIAQANQNRDYRERAQYSAEAVIEQYRNTAFVNSEQKVRV